MATARQRYEKLVTERQPYLDRARECAKLTIPSLIPPDSSNGTTKFVTPYQGLGARGVNNLASKLMLAILPANAPFFRLSIDDYTLEELTEQEGMRAEVEEALNRIERAVQNDIETTGVRPSVFEALRHLTCAGNTMLYLLPDGGMKVYRMDHYVVRRDGSGNPLEMITVEMIAPSAIPEEVQPLIKDLDPESDKDLELYTRIYRMGQRYYYYSEINDTLVPGTEGEIPIDKCPWIPLRFVKVDGEHYGRSYVEEYLGDLKTLEALTAAITEGSAAAAKIIFFVDPNGVTRAKVLETTPNLGVASGNANDITVLRLEKFADFRVAMETAAKIEERLSLAFMMNSSVQRGGDRVTAEEIRYVAGELDDALGGVYSILSMELQMPLVSAKMHLLEKARKLPSLPKDSVRPQITAGMEALGRGHDLAKLTAFLDLLMPLEQASPGIVSEYLNMGDFIKRCGTGLTIDMKGLVRTQEEVEQVRQQREMEQMMSQMAPGMMPQQPTE